MKDEFKTSNNTKLGTLAQLDRWFSSNCNGDWEHTYGIVLETLDNPGWDLTIALRDTPLFGKPFPVRAERLSDSDWIHCAVSDGIFRGSAGVGRLEELVQVFLSWAKLNNDIGDH